jgi:FKBP-type peptidyl-prolyl cis-trans isomerase FkpA
MSVTAVPLRPIRKGSVPRFWVAIALVLLASVALAWAGGRQFGETQSGLRYQMIEAGTGASPSKDDFALVGYKGMLPSGKVFDENPGAPMELASTVPGFSEAVTLLKTGGKLRVWIPANLAYGENPPPGSPIPANSPLQFEIKLIEFKTRAEVMEAQRQMQMQQQMQQMMQGMGGQGAMPPGMAPGEMPPGMAPPAP